MDTRLSPRAHSESGSVLIYILLAVVLFAILAAAISQTDRGATTGPDQDVNQLQATEILQYGRGLQTAVQAMVIDGRDPSQIDFDNAVVPGYTNNACPDDSCKIFASGGGGLAYITPLPDKWLDPTKAGSPGYGTWVFSGANAFPAVATDDGSDASADLAVILPYVQKNLCLQINTMLGISNPNGDAPKIHENADLADKFTGTFSTVQSLTGGDPALSGQRAGCFQGNGTPPVGSYHFFQILLAR